MKIGRVEMSVAAIVLLGIQLALVLSIAGKYLYERETCPRVWTRAVPYSPEIPKPSRYLSAHLEVDGCGSTLPSATHAQFPRDINGAVKPGPYVVRGAAVNFNANLKVENNRLIAVRIEGNNNPNDGQQVWAENDAPCDQMNLISVTDFFISENASSPLPLKQGQELWIEVTLPPKGAPRPIQLAVKDNGVWKPL